MEYIPGGATQNSVRVAQWVLRSPDATAYFGCIGADDFGKIMRDFATRDGVDVRHSSHALSRRRSAASSLTCTGPAATWAAQSRRAYQSQAAMGRCRSSVRTKKAVVGLHTHPLLYKILEGRLLGRNKRITCISQARTLQARYMVDEATPTGTCAVAIMGGERSLTANLGAANNYKVFFCPTGKPKCSFGLVTDNRLQKNRLQYEQDFELSSGILHATVRT